MAQYDGSIRINTEINSKNASAQLMSLQSRIVKTADKIASLRSKMDALKNAQVPTKEYQDISAQVEKAEQKFNKLLEKQEQMRREGKDNGVAWERLNAQIDEVGNEIRYAKGELKDLVDTGKAFVLGSDTQEYANLGQQLGYLENDYSVLIQRRNEFMQKHDIKDFGYERLQASLEELKRITVGIINPVESMKSAFSSAMEGMKEKAASIAASIVNGIAHPFQTMKTIASGAISGTSKLLSGMASVAKKVGSAISAIVSVLKKATSSMSLFGKSTRSSNNMLQSGFKNILKYGLGIRSMYALINKFRTAVKEGFGNLAQYSVPVNAALSSLKSALTQLKNSLATAFAPILTAIAPALTTLINLASKAATAVGMLIAALTGQKSFVKATSVQQNYADSLGETAGAAKKAVKALAGFDKLNVLNNNDSDDSGDGGSGGGAAGAGDMFETVDIPSVIKNLAKMIKDAWKEADFTEIGALIGNTLKDALDNIPWDKIQATAARVGKSLATLINGFVEVDGLGYTIGKSIGEAINTGIIGINAFLDNTHWDSVGKFIGEGLNGIIDAIDWKGLGHLFAAKFNAIFETIGNAVRTFKWKDFGKDLATSINTFIKDFKWEENGAHLSELIKGLLDALITSLEEIKWDELGANIAKFLNNIDWNGIFKRIGTFAADIINAISGLLINFADGFEWSEFGTSIANGINDFFEKTEWGDLAKGISDFAKGILDMILEAVDGINWEEVGESIADFILGIDWAGIAAELWIIGQDLSFGILEGILSLFGLSEIAKWLRENVFDPFIEAFKELFGIHSPSTVMKEQGNFIMEGLLNGISEMIDSVKEKFGEIKDKILKKWEEVKTNTKEKWESIKSTVSKLWNGLKTSASSVFEKIRSTVVSVWNKIKSSTKSIWNGIKSAIKTPINAIIGFINKMISGIVSAINTMTKALNSISFSVPDWVPGIGGSSFGLNIPQITAPQIPKLASGAVIRGGDPFLAVLGDQPHGQMNVEAPLDTIRQANKQAVLEVLSQLGVSARNGSNFGNETFVFQVEGKTFFEIMRKEARMHFKATGQSAFPI